MPSCAAEVNQAALCEHEDLVAVFIDVLIYLGFYGNLLDAGPAVQLIDLYFIIKVAYVADYGLVLHPGHMLCSNYILVSGCGYVDIAYTEGFFYSFNLKTFHGRLKRAYRVNLSNNNPCTEAAHGLSGAFSDIAVAADDCHLTGYHNICCPLDAVCERLAAAVEVIELALCYTVVNVYGRKKQASVFHHVIESVHACSCLFRAAADFRHHTAEIIGIFGIYCFKKCLDYLFFMLFTRLIYPSGTFFKLVALVY